MKKLFIISAAVAMLAMTACNEKPAKATDATENEEKTAIEKIDSTKQKAIVDVKKAAPTEDGKDHTVAEFNTKEYQVKLENLADGTYRLSMWEPGQAKDSKPSQMVETKQCVMQKGNYLMKDGSGKIYVIKSTAGKEELTIMDKNNIIYHGGNGK